MISDELLLLAVSLSMSPLVLLILPSIFFCLDNATPSFFHSFRIFDIETKVVRVNLRVVVHIHFAGQSAYYVVLLIGLGCCGGKTLVGAIVASAGNNDPYASGDEHQKNNVGLLHNRVLGATKCNAKLRQNVQFGLGGAVFNKT